MGRDKRQYRFVQDTRYGRAVLAESYEVPAMVDAITRYVARRLVERERALSDDEARGVAQSVLRRARNQRRWRAVRIFIYGLIVGVVALFALAMLSSPHS
jgi:CRP-like cAMP-binding protein